ncbi:MAG: hypothetical protein WA688_08495 [Thermoplasmata archaeon]
MRYAREMTSEMAQPTTLGVLEPEAQAIGLLKRARLSAWGALVAEAALQALFLWGVNPNNLAYSLSVLTQVGALFAFVAIALLLPVLTVVWVGWTLQSVRRGDWTQASRRLPVIVVLGYASLIGPGFYLHETVHLLDSPAWPRRDPSIARSAR